MNIYIVKEKKDTNKAVLDTNNWLLKGLDTGVRIGLIKQNTYDYEYYYDFTPENFPDNGHYIVFLRKARPIIVHDDVMRMSIQLMLTIMGDQTYGRVLVYRKDTNMFVYFYGEPILKDITAKEVGSTSFSSLLVQEMPDMQNKKITDDKKKQLIRGCQSQNSLAYLEAQVDFLSAIMNAVVSTDPALKDRITKAFPLYEKYIDAIISNSILSIKPAEDCLNEIIVEKSKVRNKQESYYEQKYSE